MADMTVMELIIFPLLMTLTIGGFWYARSHAKVARGLTPGSWSRG